MAQQLSSENPSRQANPISEDLNANILRFPAS